MTVRKTLFGDQGDWLAHTLAHAGTEVTAAEAQLADGTRIQRHALGILELTPPDSRRNPNQEALIVSAGIHGNETAPVEILNGLVNELLDGRWQLACPLLLILGNPAAMVAGSRFVDTNLNRLFHGAQPADPELPEVARARLLEHYCRRFATAVSGLSLSHYDLHTAIRPSLRERFALYPFVPERQVPAEQCNCLMEAGIDTLLLQHKEATTFSSFSASVLGAQSFTFELGRVRPFGHNDPERFMAVRNALRRRFTGAPAPEPDPERSLTVFEVVHEIIHTGEGFRLHVSDDTANFTEYAPGTVIWEDGSNCYRVGERPEAIVFPNRDVPTGQRAGLMIRPRS